MEPYDFESREQLTKHDALMLPLVGLACALWLSVGPVVASLVALAESLTHRGGRT